MNHIDVEGKCNEKYFGLGMRVIMSHRIRNRDFDITDYILFPDQTSDAIIKSCLETMSAIGCQSELPLYRDDVFKDIFKTPAYRLGKKTAIHITREYLKSNLCLEAFDSEYVRSRLITEKKNRPLIFAYTLLYLVYLSDRVYQELNRG